MKHLKIKILSILTLIILGVATVVMGYYILHDKQEDDQRMAEVHKSVRINYEQIIGDTIQFYTARANANIHSPNVIHTIRTGDHDALYRLIQPRWEVLKNENPSLIILQFHKADGTSLLRMHQPSEYGDSIALKRSMVAHIHQYHKKISGFEGGLQGVAFRILVPIIDHGEYLGAVEFGIAPPYLTEKIHRYTEYDSFFLLRQNILGTFTHIDHYFPMGDYIAINVPSRFLPLLKQYKSNHRILDSVTVKYNNQSYAISSVSIMNYLNQPIGAVMFIREIPDFWRHAVNMILATLFITFTLMITLALVINRTYNTIADTINFQELYSQTILDAIPSPVIVTDGNKLIAANQTFLHYFHYENIESFQKDHKCVCEYFEIGDTNDFLMPMNNDQRWTQYVSNNPNIHHKAKITINGVTTVFDVKLSVLHFQEQFRYVVIFTDISSMQALSITDQLTGIANRLHFSMIYEHAINVARREHKPLGVIFFDIDHFKQVNDHHGHLIGDTVLKQVAGLVKEKIRKSDIVARWGGEEFIILLPNTDLDEAVKIAETLRLAIENKPFETIEKLTCSFGAVALHENESSEELLKRVDDLLYEAKAKGRNQVVQ